jgi:hypothetical protein
MLPYDQCPVAQREPLTWIIRNRYIKRCNEKRRPGGPGLVLGDAFRPTTKI